MWDDELHLITNAIKECLHSGWSVSDPDTSYLPGDAYRAARHRWYIEKVEGKLLRVLTINVQSDCRQKPDVSIDDLKTWICNAMEIGAGEWGN